MIAIAAVCTNIVAFPLEIIQLEQFMEDKLFQKLYFAYGEILNEVFGDQIELVLLVVDDHHTVRNVADRLMRKERISFENVIVNVELDLSWHFQLLLLTKYIIIHQINYMNIFLSRY